MALILLTWLGLADVAHHHAYELAPTAAEPHTWHTKATELATLLPAHSTVAVGNTSYRPVTTQISNSMIQNEFGFLSPPTDRRPAW